MLDEASQLFMDNHFHEIRTEDGLTLWQITGMPVVSGYWWAAEGVTLGPLLIEQSHDPYNVPQHRLDPGMIVIDCGANIGTFSRRALELGASLVIAFEPSPATYRALRLNVKAGQSDSRVIAIKSACWYETGITLPLHINAIDAGWNSVCIPTNASSTVNVTTVAIDDVVRLHSLDHVDIIKMDVEGAEIQTLAGAKDTIKRFHPRIIIAAEHRPDDLTALPLELYKIDASYMIDIIGLNLFCEWPGKR